MACEVVHGWIERVVFDAEGAPDICLAAVFLCLLMDEVGGIARRGKCSDIEKRA